MSIASTMKDTAASFARNIWASHGLPLSLLDRLHLSEHPDPTVNSHFKLGTAAQTSIGLSALAASYFHQLRTGESQDVSVDARHATLEFSAEKYYLVDGKLHENALFDELAGMCPTKDGFVRLHTNFPHHKQGILDILRCPPTRPAVEAALSTWPALSFEQEALRRGMCVAALRPFDALEMFPPGRPANDDDAAPVRITKIGEAPRREVGSAGEGTFALALEGIRVLDLTRVLAGPVCGRTLAAHGADVLWITSPDLPSLPFLDADTSRGKRTTQLDLNTSPGRATLRALAEDADVFLQAYRPGGLAARGFGPEDVANMRPGIVYASLSAYPEDSLWKDVRGFDSLVQTLSGFNVAEAQAYAAHVRESEGDATRLPPFRALPMQALDHAAGSKYGFLTGRDYSQHEFSESYLSSCWTCKNGNASGGHIGAHYAYPK
ncbi:CoA-transferase family III domain-containing protein [Amylostereum chailletii]|nr:CoA-transferase family III domain-containing protein [Amylostereum chailletii]